MRVLVTGADGYVARATARAFRIAGDEVIGTSRHAGSAPNRVYVDDIGPDTEWTRALAGVDAVIHLAARVHVRDETAADPLAAFRRVNRDGTAALAAAARLAGVQTFVFVSTIAVVAQHSESPVTEQSPCHPVGPYATSKHEAEQAALGESSRMRVVILRPPMVYGRDAPGNFGPLVRAIRRGVPLPLGAVRNRRSFIYIDNLADAVVKAIADPRARGVYHVADDLGVSTPEFARMIGDAAGRAARIVAVPVGALRVAAGLLGQSEMLDKLIQSLPVDSTRFRHDLGWTPPLTMREALRAGLAS